MPDDVRGHTRCEMAIFVYPRGAKATFCRRQVSQSVSQSYCSSVAWLNQLRCISYIKDSIPKISSLENSLLPDVSLEALLLFYEYTLYPIQQGRQQGKG